jgi:hypothetical protein
MAKSCPQKKFLVALTRLCLGQQPDLTPVQTEAIENMVLATYDMMIPFLPNPFQSQEHTSRPHLDDGREQEYKPHPDAHPRHHEKLNKSEDSFFPETLPTDIKEPKKQPKKETKETKETKEPKKGPGCCANKGATVEPSYPDVQFNQVSGQVHDSWLGMMLGNARIVDVCNCLQDSSKMMKLMTGKS